MSGSAMEWSPPSAERDRPGVDHVADEALDRRVREATGVGWDHRRVAEVHHPQRLERIDPGVEVHPAEAVLAIRIARGPRRAPGSCVTSSSRGAPTIATSTPARSSTDSV